MKIVLYSTGCPKCKVLEKKLNDKQIPYTLETNVDRLIELGFKMAPILEVDGLLMQFADANKYLNDWSN